jgi:hypothetical protein
MAPACQLGLQCGRGFEFHTTTTRSLPRTSRIRPSALSTCAHHVVSSPSIRNRTSMSAEGRNIFAALTALSRPPPPLRPVGPYDATLTQSIDGLPDGAPLRAALHLLNDDVARAHEIAQAHEGIQTADYVHSQLHRREGDYWNSKASSTSAFKENDLDRGAAIVVDTLRHAQNTSGHGACAWRFRRCCGVR